MLNRIGIPKLSIKWPNDILSAQKKIAGILIESVIKSSKDSFAIIGIGLNVNQKLFSSHFKASSIMNIMGKHFDLDELLVLLLTELEKQINVLKKGDYDLFHVAFENKLFRKDKPSTFINAEGVMFMGFIKNVTKEGRLKILTENNILREFNLKEVKLLY